MGLRMTSMVGASAEGPSMKQLGRAKSAVTLDLIFCLFYRSFQRLHTVSPTLSEVDPVVPSYGPITLVNPGQHHYQPPTKQGPMMLRMPLKKVWARRKILECLPPRRVSRGGSASSFKKGRPTSIRLSVAGGRGDGHACRQA